MSAGAGALGAEAEAAVAIAQAAGARLLDWQGRLGSGDVRSKSAARDLVSAADLDSEGVVLAGLREHFPLDGVCAEESGGEHQDRAAVWFADPLDGTVNFVHGLPLYAVSLGRLRAGEPDLAVVHAPALGETYVAARGRGAWSESGRLAVSATATLAEAVLATGFPYRRNWLLDDNLENFGRLFHRVRGMRRLGAAALDLAWVAAGRLDAFWELHLQPFDVAAGGLLVREAGGEVGALVPGGDWLHGGSFVAGPAPLVAAIRAVLLEGRPPDYPPLGERDTPRLG
ncbi:MAG TPA: inositol monophosphatase family protein [Planctomycetota bacterium]